MTENKHMSNQGIVAPQSAIEDLKAEQEKKNAEYRQKIDGIVSQIIVMFRENQLSVRDIDNIIKVLNNVMESALNELNINFVLNTAIAEIKQDENK